MQVPGVKKKRQILTYLTHVLIDPGHYLLCCLERNTRDAEGLLNTTVYQYANITQHDKHSSS